MTKQHKIIELKKIIKSKLKVSAFFCGAIVMITEISGARLIAPFVGTSIFVWTSLITVILSSLSIGYWYGGKKADKTPELKSFARIVMFASIALALLTFATGSIFQFISGFALDLKWEALILSLVIFFIPGVFLGMTLPFCIRLYIQSIDTSGSNVGNIYAISTIGSITGTFFTGFVLIPLLGIDYIFFICFLCLFALSIILHPPIIKKVENIIIFIFIVAFFIWTQLKEKKYTQINSQYGTIFIIDTIDNQSKRPIRLLYNNNTLFSGNYLDGNREYTFEYFDFFIHAIDLSPQVNKVLMLGGAGCSFTNSFLSKYPHAEIDIVEIDPAMEDIAYNYFFLDSSSQHQIIAIDGRIYLNKLHKKYDVILMDVFQDLRLPHHLSTIEFFSKTIDQLNNNGVLVINIIGTLKSKYTGSIIHTLEEAYPKVNIFPLCTNTQKLQNIMLVAYKNIDEINTKRIEEIKSHMPKEYKGTIHKPAPILTDNYAPVEYYYQQ